MTSYSVIFYDVLVFIQTHSEYKCKTKMPFLSIRPVLFSLALLKITCRNIKALIIISFVIQYSTRQEKRTVF
jgi:hypothetical protein